MKSTCGYFPIRKQAPVTKDKRINYVNNVGIRSVHAVHFELSIYTGREMYPFWPPGTEEQSCAECTKNLLLFTHVDTIIEVIGLTE